MNKPKNAKKAIWVSDDMHLELSILAATNRQDIGKIAEYLIKLGMIADKENKQ
jgi:hypothetical protein